MFTDVYDKRCVKLSEQSCTINDLEEMLLLTGCLTPTQFLNADRGHQLLSARPPWCCSVGEPPTRPTFSFILRRSESLTASIYRSCIRPLLVWSGDFHSHWCQIFTSPLQRCVSNVSHTQQDDGSAFVCVQMFLTASPSTRSTCQTHNSSSVRSAWCWGMCEHIASPELINWINSSNRESFEQSWNPWMLHIFIRLHSD